MRGGGRPFPKKGEKGGAIVNVLIALVIVTSAFAIFSDTVIRERTQVLRTTSVLNLRFALNSLVDYVLFGLRQKWCFSDNFMADPNCNLRHPASTMRVAMSNDEENHIRSLIASGVDVGPYVDINHLSLNSFELSIKFNEVSSLHPLFPILQTINSPHVKGVYVKVTRDRSVYLPKSGGEAFLDVLVELMDEDGRHPVLAGGGVLSLTSRVSVHPRELGSFGLVMAKNLYLDRNAKDPPPSKGDVIIGNGGFTQSRGLTLLSPTFVNENIYLPTTNYTPITFADRVYMGNGKVFKGTLPFSPETPGGIGARLWSEMTSRFGGFLNGLENDGKIDRGLVHAFQAPNSLPSTDINLMQRCILHSQYLADQKKLANNILSARLRTGNSTNDYLYTVGFENKKWMEENPAQSNEFYAQDIASNVDTSNWRTNRANLATDESSSAPNKVLKLEMSIGQNALTAELGRGSVLRITPNFLGDISEKIAELERRLGGGQQGNGGQTPGNNDGQQQNNGGQWGGGGQLGSSGGQQQGSGRQWGDGGSSQVRLDALKQLRDNYRQPEIIVSVSPVKYENVEQPHVLDVRVKFVNPEFLLDHRLERKVPVMSFKGYDPSYVRGNILSSNHGGLNHQTRYLNFAASFDGKTLVAPGGFSGSVGGPWETVQSEVFEFNWGKFNQDCDNLRGAKEGQAFGAAPWDYDFSPKARESWNFAGDSGVALGDPVLPEIVFDANNARLNPSNATFQVRSIVGLCRIRSSAELVTGFMTCDKLLIEPRTSPLRIIGTIIVGSLEIDPTALAAGIRWSSIYYPEATFELRRAGILKTSSGAACVEGPDPLNPIWHPIPSIEKVAARFSCNAISLRAKADPFQWTSVSPDCGRMPGASATSCKRHPENFFVVEYSREGGI